MDPSEATSPSLKFPGPLYRLARALESAASLQKIGLSLALFMSAYFLICYIASNDLVMPTSVMAAASLYLAIGVTSLVLVGFIAAYVVGGTIAARKLLGPNFELFLLTSRDGLISSKASVQCRKLALCFVGPQLILAALFFVGQNAALSQGYLAAVGLLLIPGLFALDATTLRTAMCVPGSSLRWNSRAARTLRLWGAILLLNGLVVLSGLLFLLLLNLRGLLRDYESYIFASVLFVTVNTIAIMSDLKANGLGTDGSTGRWSADATISSNAVLAIFMMAIICLLPTLANQVAGSALRLLGMGGGAPRIIYAPIKGKGALPKSLVATCDNASETCESKPLSLWLDAGDQLFVSLPRDPRHIIYRVFCGESALAWTRDRPQ
ncbi:hypothetical protein [Pinirhizobacter soli]|uniref:hypothetical protein n=1 Tax=Pinirhizobacter soli TaxID=2786953 RepID=UPI002029EDC1|nr:hypothetical protein [Pinirhizobacter soli]